MSITCIPIISHFPQLVLVKSPISQCPEARHAPHAAFNPWPAERRVPLANVADGLPPVWDWVDDWIIGLIGNMHGYILIYKDIYIYMNIYIY
jgi:hypothetical protein